MHERRAALRRSLMAVALVSAAWSTLLLVTNGVVLRLGPLRVSSRNFRNPAIAALLLAGVAIASAPKGARLGVFLDDAAAARRRAREAINRASPALGRALALMAGQRSMTIAAVLMCAGIITLSWTRGAWIAGGSDSFGYVHQAHLLASGHLRFRTALMPPVSPMIPLQAATPLGYNPSTDGSTVVPVYSPGLPLTMAAVEKIAGPAAVFVVTPLLSALTIWFTFLLGRRVHGSAVGAAAALLVFAAPAFRFMVISAPMSDIPAAAWWTLALWLVLSEGLATAAIAGVAAGLAILTRPNLVLLAAPCGCYLLWHVVQARALSGAAARRLVLFSAGVLAGCLVEAWFNTQWYGSPLTSGYDTSHLFNWSYWRDNIRDYPSWLTTTQTPLFFLGFVAPVLATRRRDAVILLVAFALVEFLSYLFYMDFGLWWYLRFLLPAYPAMAVATCVTLDSLAMRCGPWRRPLMAAVVIGVTIFSLNRSVDLDARGEYRYRAVAEFVRDRLPRRAVIVSMQHSGNVILYSGRPIVRYDGILPEDLDHALGDLEHLGYHPYVVLDGWEATNFRQRFQGRSRIAALDWPPLATVEGTQTSVWDLVERADAARARPVAKIPLQ